MTVEDLDSGLRGSTVGSYIVPELDPLIVTVGDSFQTLIFSRAFSLYATLLNRKTILLTNIRPICNLYSNEYICAHS